MFAQQVEMIKLFCNGDILLTKRQPLKVQKMQMWKLIIFL